MNVSCQWLPDEWLSFWCVTSKWIASSEFGIYRLCEQRRFRQACASTQSRQNLRCSLIQAVSQEEPSDRKPDPWPLWMAGHAQLKFVMTECSKTQIRLTGLKWFWLPTTVLILPPLVPPGCHNQSNPQLRWPLQNDHHCGSMKLWTI